MLVWSVNRKFVIAVLTSMLLSACGESGGSNTASSNSQNSSNDVDSSQLDQVPAFDVTPGPDASDLDSKVDTSEEETLIVLDTSEKILDASEAQAQDEEVVEQLGFAIAKRYPENNDKNRALRTQIRFTFNKPLINGEFDNEQLIVTANNRVVRGIVTYNDSLREVVFIPYSSLVPNTEYQVSIGENVMSVDGDLAGALNWTFKTTADVGSTPQDVIDNCMSSQDIAMLAAVNEARSQTQTCAGVSFAPVGKITWSCELADAAQLHANEMVRNNFFGHVSMDGSTVGSRASNAGYSWNSVGENIAAGQMSVNEALEAWKESAAHCENLMSPKFSQMGAGFSECMATDYRTYWTQTFASPKR